MTISAALILTGSPGSGKSSVLNSLSTLAASRRAAGRDLFLAVATTETSIELQGVIDALAVDRAPAGGLYAPPEVVAGRIADREPDYWPGKEPLIAHARKLATSIPPIAGIDVMVNTQARSAAEVAAEVRALLYDHELIPA